MNTNLWMCPVHLAACYQTIDRHTSQFLVLWLKAIAELDISSIIQSITVGQESALMQNHQCTLSPDTELDSSPLISPFTNFPVFKNFPFYCTGL